MPTLEQIAETLGAELRGDANHVVTRLATIQHANADSLTFLANSHYLPHLAATSAGAVLCRPEHADVSPVATLVIDDPYLAYARISHQFDLRPTIKPGIDSSALIDTSVFIPASAYIGPNVVISADTKIGEGCVIMAGCVVGARCHIGDGARLWPRVTLYHDVSVGRRCQFHSGVVVGADGFGFAPSNEGWLSIAQLAGVSIGNDVHIGANTTIDRGALEDTIINNDVIIDNQVQIGHNVVIGSHTAIAGSVGIAGSATIGQHCLIGGAVGIAGHLHICDGVQVSGMSRVTGNITEPGVYASGTPLGKVKEWRKNAVRFQYLNDIYQRLRRLEK